MNETENKLSLAGAKCMPVMHLSLDLHVVPVDHLLKIK